MQEDRGGWHSEFDTPVHAETEWTAANIQEALPGLLTPLTWSLMRDTLEYAFGEPARRVGIDVPHADPYVALFYNRAFLNATAFRDIAGRIPFSSASAIDEHFLGRDRGEQARLNLSLRDLVRLPPILARMGQRFLALTRELRDLEARMARDERRDTVVPLAYLPPRVLLARVRESLPLAREVAAFHIEVTGGASTAFDWLGHLTRLWLDDTTGSLQAQLVSGLDELESAAPGRQLWQLARQASGSPRVQRLLESDTPEAELEELRKATSPDAVSFLTDYDAFIARHGHRSVMEMELAAKSWAEDPASVLALLRALSKLAPESNPEVLAKTQRQRREAATEDARRRLGSVKSLVFNRALSETQRYIVLRERTKSMVVRGVSGSRRLVRYAAEYFAQTELLASADDIYFLTLDESSQLARSQNGDLYRERTERRRFEYERNRAVELPETFRGHPTPLSKPRATARILKGIAVSPGRVTGRARIILDPRADAHIEPGDILVAPITDAAWTPLFMAVAGLVVDVGGQLSHGATVARELGLPAVVNVKHATSSIRDGQQITLDGSTGEVFLEES